MTPTPDEVAATSPESIVEEIVSVIRRYLQHDSQRPCSWHEVEDCIEAIRSLESLSPPAGMVMVPGEPTGAMIERGGETRTWQSDMTGEDIDSLVADVYRAMLSARERKEKDSPAEAWAKLPQYSPRKD